MEERYEPLKDLGVGNFGVARLVRDKKTKELVAVKYIERGKKVISIWSKVNSFMLKTLQMLVLEVVMCFTSCFILICKLGLFLPPPKKKQVHRNSLVKIKHCLA